MRFKNFKISSKIFTGFIVLICFILAMGIFTLSRIADLTDNSIPLLMLNEEIYQNTLEMTSAESNYLLYDLVNPDYFETSNSEYLNDYNESYTLLTNNIKKMTDHSAIKGDPELVSILSEIETSTKSYYNTFSQVASKNLEKGFSDFGITGEFRNAVHDLEDALKLYPNQMKLEMLVLEIRRNEKDYLLRNDPKYIARVNSSLDKLKSAIENSSIAAKDDLYKLLTQYKSKFTALTNVDAEIGRSASEGLTAQYLKSSSSIGPLIDSLNLKLNELINKKVKSLSTILISAVAVAMIAAISIGFIISKIIANPIKQTTDRLEDIAQGEGDLTRTLNVNSKDELGLLAKWFNIFVDKIKQTIIVVQEDANNLSDSANILSSSIDEATLHLESISNEVTTVSGGMQNNASLAEELTASIEEVASGNSMMSQEADNAANNSSKALDAANTGQHQLDSVVNKIDSLKLHSNDVVNSMTELRSSSNQINTVVDIIANIAEQTNLLALNAAIEAARAGEHGKGFAVVAEEVRKLAEESRQSTDQIVGLVQTVISHADKADKAIEQEENMIDESVLSVHDTKKSFEEILSLIKETVEKISSIAELARHQSEVTDEMSKAMDDFSRTTQETAESANDINNQIHDEVKVFEDIQENIKSLESMSQNLKVISDAFKVK